MRLCKDCKHFRDSIASCWHPKNMQADYIDGKLTSRNSISFLRGDELKCGEEARWFEPKKGA